MAGNAGPLFPIDIDLSRPENSVSVIMPVYNGEKFIAETLDSILGQTVPPAEVIVVDDASTDQSARIVREYGDPVVLMSAQCHDARAARNIGASKAQGNWLAFCDADDLWLPTKLEKQLHLAGEAPDVHCVLTDYAELTDGVVGERSHFSYAPHDFWTQEPRQAGFVVRTPITGKLTTFQPGITSTPIVKRSFYEREGGFDERSIKKAHDTCYLFHCLRVVPFGVVPEVLMHYRRHPDSMSADSLQQMRSTVEIWNYILANYPQAEPFRAELLEGLKAMRKEISVSARYLWRQKAKRRLGFS